MKFFLSPLPHWSVLSLLIFHAIHVTSFPAAVKRQTSPVTPQGLLTAFEQFLAGIPLGILNQTDVLLPLPIGDYTITQKATDPVIRAAEIATTRATFLYGPPVAGGPYFPTGALGLARVALDQAFIQLDLVPELALAVTDLGQAAVDVAKVCLFGFRLRPQILMQS